MNAVQLFIQLLQIRFRIRRRFRAFLTIKNIQCLAPVHVSHKNTASRRGIERDLMSDLNHIHIGIAAFAACHIHHCSMLHDAEDHIPVDLFRQSPHRHLCRLRQRTSLYDPGSDCADLISKTIFFRMFVLNDKMISL